MRKEVELLIPRTLYMGSGSIPMQFTLAPYSQKRFCVIWGNNSLWTFAASS